MRNIIAGAALAVGAAWSLSVLLIDDPQETARAKESLDSPFRSAVLTAAAPKSYRVTYVTHGPPPTKTPPAPTPPPWQSDLCKARWPIFVQAGARFGVDPALLSIVSLIEAGCGAAQVSSAGAQGPMQVMPATAEYIAGALGEPLTLRWKTDPAENIKLGAWYFARQMRSCAAAGATGTPPDYAETVRCACVGYNAGGGMVQHWLGNRAKVPAESKAHQYWIGGIWEQRHMAAPPILTEWAGAGGRLWMQAAPP